MFNNNLSLLLRITNLSSVLNHKKLLDLGFQIYVSRFKLYQLIACFSSFFSRKFDLLFQKDYLFELGKELYLLYELVKFTFADVFFLAG